MFSVYHLRNSAAFIRAVQNATLHRPGYGIEVTHGLFGSEEWWNNIATGKLLLATISGTISRVGMDSMGDWPEFDLLADGQPTTWNRETDKREFDSLYCVGVHAEIDYVVQWLKKEALLIPGMRDREQKVVIEIRLATPRHRLA